MTTDHRGLILALLFAAVTLPGCLGKYHYPLREESRSLAARAVLPTPIPASYEYQPVPLRPRIVRDLPQPDEAYRVYRLHFPSVGHNGQEDNAVNAVYHRSTSPGRKGLVLILPIWGSSTYPSGTTLKHLTRGPVRGQLHILMLEGSGSLYDWRALAEARDETEFFREIDRSTRAVRNTVIDIRRLLDWAEGRPEIDRWRMGIAGFSMGAIVGSLAMGVDRRFAAGVLVMGGGNLDEILAACSGRPERVRRSVLARFGWSLETFRRRLEGPLDSVNPLRFAPRIDPAKVLFVDAARDRCMPESGRTALWNALGRPERISILGGHKRSFLSMTPLDLYSTRRAIREFFRRRLLESPREEPLALATSAAASS